MSFVVIAYPWLTPLFFGAIISPTDPIPVLAIFKDLGTDEQLSNLIEAESLFNDGIAVVLFIVISSLLTNSGITAATGATVVAFGACLAADHFHFSGVFAVVVASLAVGNYGIPWGMSPSSQIAVHSFWEYIVFAVNSAVFLLVGLEEANVTLELTLLLVAVAICAVLLGRAVTIYVWPRHSAEYGGPSDTLALASRLGLERVAGGPFLWPWFRD